MHFKIDKTWPEENELVCRGKEQCGRFLFDQETEEKIFLHFVQLFVTGSPQGFPLLSMQELIDWGNNPDHSYVNDGAGAMTVVAHISSKHEDLLSELKGFAGIEISHGGNCGWADRIWDNLLSRQHRNDETYIWGFAGDDTHRLNPDYANASWIGIKLRQHNTVELKKAMRDGAVYASNGVVIEDFSVSDNTIIVKCEKACEVRWLKSGQYYEDMGLEKGVHAGCDTVKEKDLTASDSKELMSIIEPQQTSLPGANKCLKIDKCSTCSSYTLTKEDLESAGYIRCVVFDPEDLERLKKLIDDGKEISEIHAEKINLRKSFSMPFRISGNGTIKSPYPADGEWIRGMTHNHSDLTVNRLSEIEEYHQAYRDYGQAASFETGYSYWLSPYIFYPQEATPIVEAVSSEHCVDGQSFDIEVVGKYFQEDVEVYAGGKQCDIIENTRNRILAKAPENLALGSYDISVLNPSTPYKHTLENAFSIKSSLADNSNWTAFSVKNGLPDNGVYMVRYLDGTLWAGTKNGLAYFDGDKFVSVGGGPDNAEGVALDQDGTLWACGWDGVYSRPQNGQWKHWVDKDGLEIFNKLHDIRCSPQGEIMITHYRANRISIYNGKNWRIENLDSPRQDNAATFLTESPDGRLYAGSIGNGVLAYNGRKWKPADLPPLKTASPRRIGFDLKGRMVIASVDTNTERSGGVHILDNGNWNVIDSKSGLPDNKITALAFDNNDMIWAATANGLTRINQSGQVKVYTTLNCGLPNDNITDLCVTKENELCIATINGIGRLRLTK